uniref:FAM113A n=1 Tax=Caligus rogercresseyi TaxID=217165 RepID=C1BNM3_CALRO|nr:FAM113A [Caligus rogercresseyi]
MQIMADIFLCEDVSRLTKHQSFLFIGDSNMRAIYKDLVWLSNPSHQDSLIPVHHLREKMEKSYEGDALIDSSGLTAGRDYRETRDFFSQGNDTQFTFHFVTRCFSPRLQESLRTWKREFGSYPDVIVMNGALWDLSRWGVNAVVSYKESIIKLFELLKELLPPYTQVIWLTSTPVSRKVKGGIILPQIQSIGETLRFTIVEANRYAARVASSHGFDVLDIHGSFICQMHRQCSDGIHWHPDSVRMMVNMILTHFSLSRNCKLPGRIPPSQSVLLRQMLFARDEALTLPPGGPHHEGEEEAGRQRVVLRARRRIL